MATKKAAPLQKSETAKTSVAVRKPAAGAVVSIKEALAAQAAAMGERTQPSSGNRIRLSKGKFTLPDGVETEGPLELVIVDFKATNKFYEGKYDPKNPAPPACIAIGVNPRDMVPSDNSPNKQCDDCQSCPNNQFGSDGNGKACKNSRILAVLPPDAEEGTELWTLEVSPTGLKAFDGYVGSVARQFQMPPVGVITTVTLDPNVDYPRLQFGNPVPNPNIDACFIRQGEAQELLSVEPDMSTYQPAAKAPVRKPAARR